MPQASARFKILEAHDLFLGTGVLRPIVPRQGSYRKEILVGMEIRLGLLSQSGRSEHQLVRVLETPCRGCLATRYKDLGVQPTDRPR